MAYTKADLEMAERHIAQGKRHIREQVDRIELLRSGGHATEKAEDLLRLFLDTLAQHERHRDLISEELKAT